jgi:7-cyano-7-deazaguanine synthase
MTSQKDAVLLASGGLDSTTLMYDLVAQGIRVTPLFVNYGQHCASIELETLRDVLPRDGVEPIRVVNISDIYRDAKSRLIQEPDLWQDNVQYQELYLPYRSLVLLSVGSAYAQAHGLGMLYAGFINSNHAKELDCSTEFFSRLHELLADYGGVEIRLPYRDWPKRRVALRGIELRAPIGRTFSCQVSSRIPCGACPNCVDRLDSLQGL